MKFRNLGNNWKIITKICTKSGAEESLRESKCTLEQSWQVGTSLIQTIFEKEFQAIEMYETYRKSLVKHSLSVIFWNILVNLKYQNVIQHQMFVKAPNGSP